MRKRRSLPASPDTGSENSKLKVGVVSLVTCALTVGAAGSVLGARVVFLLMAAVLLASGLKARRLGRQQR